MSAPEPDLWTSEDPRALLATLDRILDRFQSDAAFDSAPA